MNIAFLYLIFAGIATCINIACQWLSARLLPAPYILSGSMVIGTIAGLLVKYVLDKRWIFSFKTKNHRHQARTFLFYSAMGILTTALFWSTELAFQRLFQSEAMRYLGATLGLAIGYVAKYNLDKQFVFVEKR